MPAPTCIVLTESEDQTLFGVPQRTKGRVHMLRLNAQGWTVPAIAEIFAYICYNNVKTKTRHSLHAETNEGFLLCLLKNC